MKKYESKNYWIEERYNAWKPIKNPYVVRDKDNKAIEVFKTLDEAKQYIEEKEK